MLFFFLIEISKTNDRVSTLEEKYQNSTRQNGNFKTNFFFHKVKPLLLATQDFRSVGVGTGLE